MTIRPVLALPHSDLSRAVVRVEGDDVDRCLAALASGDAIELEGHNVSWKVLGYNSLSDNVHAFTLEPLNDVASAVTKLLGAPDVMSAPAPAPSRVIISAPDEPPARALKRG